MLEICTLFHHQKEELAKFVIKYSTNILATELKEINNGHKKKKIYLFKNI